MSMSPTSYMTSPDTSYSQTAMPSWNALASQPGSMSAYGYSSGPATQSVYGYPAAPDQQPSLYSHSASYAVQPVQPYGDYPTTMSLTGQFASLAVDSTRPAGGASGGGIVYTEQRGIHIRDLPRRASEDQVRKLIRDAAGREAELINGIEVPLDKDRNPRGWAFVHFRSADLARRMVGRLDGVEFKGRTLQVRLLKEGEAICSGGNGGGGGSCSVAVAAAASGYRSAKHGGGSAGGSGSGSSSRRDQGNGGRRREKERGERSSASSKAPPPSSSSSRSVPPLVVGSGTAGEASSSSSSSGKGKGKGKEKEKEKERERERERERHGTSRGSKCSVVIADGSLGRKRSDSDRRTAS
ncbi:hypothetical protein VPNG_05932 [Cytospora leucostoma]|uniref:RRM domain-containing protein n=1 Tax=Cytospora leucostoma TaxID=1230097 RepID=A0A423XAQ4_9PEZI|nr:hypothetical protein VPNG_05932 [Cytospora leucostoma]